MLIISLSWLAVLINTYLCLATLGNARKSKREIAALLAAMKAVYEPRESNPVIYVADK